MVPQASNGLAAGLERTSKVAVPVIVTVNLQGKTVELTQAREDALFGRASYGKYAYAVGCERLFGLLDRHGIKSTVFVPGAEAEGNPAYIAAFSIHLRQMILGVAAVGHSLRPMRCRWL
jgi:hypothetical protein